MDPAGQGGAVERGEPRPDALLDGTAPGAAVTDPAADFSGSRMRVGAGWFTVRVGMRLLRACS